MNETTRVIIGFITCDDVYSGKERVWRFWGDTAFRANEFRSVAGCVEEKRWGIFELPMTTPAAKIAMLSGNVYAPANGIPADWERGEYISSFGYETLYKEGTIRFFPKASAIVMSGEMLINRAVYHIDYQASRHVTTGEWIMQDRATRKNSGNYDGLTESAKREANRLLGGLLAGFLRSQPQALVEGRNRDLENKRNDLRQQIAKSETYTKKLRAALAALPANEALPDELPTRSGMSAGEAYEVGYEHGLQGLEDVSDSLEPEYASEYREGYAEGLRVAETQTEGGL